MTTTVLDLETTIWNKGNPFDHRNFCVRIPYLCVDSGVHGCTFYDDPLFKTTTRAVVNKTTLLVGQNIKFDIHWLTNLHIVIPQKCKVWDTMIAEFVLSGQTNSFFSLEKLAELYNLEKKSKGINEYWEQGISTEYIPRDIVEERGNSDVALTYQVYECQLKDPRMTPALHKLILVEGADLKVLQKIEYNGFLYDREGSLKESNKLQLEITEIENELYDLVGHRINLDGDELSYALFGGSSIQEIREPVELVYKSGPRIGQS